MPLATFTFEENYIHCIERPPSIQAKLKLYKLENLATEYAEIRFQQGKNNEICTS